MSDEWESEYSLRNSRQVSLPCSRRIWLLETHYPEQVSPASLSWEILASLRCCCCLPRGRSSRGRPGSPGTGCCWPAPSAAWGTCAACWWSPSRRMTRHQLLKVELYRLIFLSIMKRLQYSCIHSTKNRLTLNVHKNEQQFKYESWYFLFLEGCCYLKKEETLFRFEWVVQVCYLSPLRALQRCRVSTFGLMSSLTRIWSRFSFLL